MSMNRVSLVICGLILMATLIGAATFHDVADRYFASRGQSEGAMRCPASTPEMKIVGNSETVFFGEDRDLVFDAKVDSGAETSSIHAVNIETFQKTIVDNGVVKELLFVRFKTEDDLGRPRELERMVSRIDQVKNATGVSTRYFFREVVWIHDHSYEVELNLADRSQLSKKMLVGKNVLNQGYLIDTQKAYVATQALSAKL